MSKIEEILAQYEDMQFITPDGLDEACIGVDIMNERLVYSEEKILEILEKDQEMTQLEAREWYDYNIQGAYMGESTPLYIQTMDEEGYWEPEEGELKTPGIHTSVQLAIDGKAEVQMQIGNQSFRLAPVEGEHPQSSEDLASWYKRQLDLALNRHYNLLKATCNG